MKLIGVICCLILPFMWLSAKEYHGPKEEQRVWRAYDAFAAQFAKQFQLELLNTGLGSMMDTPRVKWAMSLVDHRQMTQDQLRPSLLQMIDTVWSKVKTDPAFAAKLDSYPKKETLHPEMIGFKIAFWDADVNRPLHPYLAQVRVTGEKISYFYADPKTQALQEPIVETLTEARQRVK